MSYNIDNASDITVPSKSPFLVLPTEVRTIIYQWLYANARFIFPDDGTPRSYLPRHFVAENISPAILLTCKQIYREARSIMYSADIAVLVMWVPSKLAPLLTDVRRLPLALRKQVRTVHISAHGYSQHPLGPYWPQLQRIRIHSQLDVWSEEKSLQTIDIVREVKKRSEMLDVFGKGALQRQFEMFPERNLILRVWYHHVHADASNGLEITFRLRDWGIEQVMKARFVKFGLEAYRFEPKYGDERTDVQDGVFIKDRVPVDITGWKL